MERRRTVCVKERELQGVLALSKTETDQALLRTCIQDLFAGCRAFADRYPRVAEQAQNRALRDELNQLVSHAAERAERLRSIDGAADGPANLWMLGILDDADRDTQTIAPGRHLDIALIGGVRKALVAEFVSLETGIALAGRIAQDDVAAIPAREPDPARSVRCYSRRSSRKHGLTPLGRRSLSGPQRRVAIGRAAFSRVISELLSRAARCFAKENDRGRTDVNWTRRAQARCRRPGR